MDAYVFASIVFFLILIASFRWMRKLMNSSGAKTSICLSQAEAEERSMSFYAPMERLLSEADFRFLSGRPEIPQSTIRQLRRDRRRVFRKYLAYLSVDFAAIIKELRTVMVESDISRPDLAHSLLRAQLLFSLAVFVIEVRLALQACGIYSVSVSASRLTQGLANMRIELRQMQSLTAPSAA